MREGDWALETGTGKVKGEGWGQVMGIERGREEDSARGTGTGGTTEGGWAQETGRGSSRGVWSSGWCLLPWRGAESEDP